MKCYGIDTSILVRLLTGDPPKEYQKIKEKLEQKIKDNPFTKITASSLVISEAYFVLQHHYEISKSEAQKALVSVLTSGLINPLHGDTILNALETTKGPGLMDRLIQIDYEAHHHETLTIDKKMAQLRQCVKL